METSERPPSLGRRALLAGAAGALAAGAARPLADPAEAAPGGRDEDLSPRKAARRLEAEARKLERFKNRFAGFAGLLVNPEDPGVNPDDPNHPAICTAPADILADSASIVATADELFASLECR